MTVAETRAYRERLIGDLMGHAAESIQENRGGWATDRLNAIRECEWDLLEAGDDVEPFVLCHALMRRSV